MKRILSLILGAALVVVLAVPVNASESGSAWIELLEFSTVDNSGQNWFRYISSAVVSVPTPYSMRLAKIDMLITYPSGQIPSKVQVSYNDTFYNLTITAIDSTTARVYGKIQNNFYSDVRIHFSRNSDAQSYLEILSCKVTPLPQQEVLASAQVLIGGAYYPQNHIIEVPGNELSESAYAQIRIDVLDWQKYDMVTIWGSATTFALSSIRATINKTALPYELTYIESFPTGETVDYNYNYTYTENYSGGGGYGNVYGSGDTAIEFGGKILYAMRIDLTNIDRTLTHPMNIYLTGVYYGMYGYTFNCQYVSGNIIVPDTSNASWWNRFTNFMSDLFGSDKGQESLDDLQQSSSSISQGASDIHAFEQSQQAVLDSGMSTIQNAVSYTSFMAALVFVQKYANMTFDGISQYAIVFTLPLFLGLFFFLCSRIPGITRWKPRPPKSEGGDSP